MKNLHFKTLAESAAPFASALLLISFILFWLSHGMTKAAQPHSPLIVPGHPQTVTVSYQDPLGRGLLSTGETIRVRNHAKVAQIAQLLNHLSPAPGRVISCPMDTGDSFVIHFRYQDGDRWTVRIDATGCRFVRSKTGVAWWLVGPDVSSYLVPLFL